MQQLEYGFNQFYEAIKPTGEEFTKLDEIDDELHKHFQAKYMIGLAKMLMHCKQFAELDFEDKILLYKHLKPIFNQIERLYSSIQYKTENIHIPMLIYDNSAVDLEGNEIVHFKNRDKESFAKTRPLWLPFRDKLVNHLYVPMNEIKLTLHELIYLCGQILWSTQEIDGISSNAHQIAKEITDQISSELHNYYMYEMRLVNYAPRLVKMIKLIDGSKTVVNALNDVTIISQVYNIFDFKADLSDLVS
uniref:NR LBD domain-containing protein n=1 Tax=Acrobeloides nanus TaxID=290746 RepID=A0A914EJK8_9BILA